MHVMWLVSGGGFWKNAEPYVYQAVVGAVALFALLKDWKDYDEASVRFGRFRKPALLVVAVLTLSAVILSMADTYHTRAEAREAQDRVDKEKDEAKHREEISQQKIDQLSAQVTDLRNDNTTNAAGFRQSFAKLYARFSDLQTRTQNEVLLKEISETKDQLVATQQKLNQPKAALVATFPTIQMIPVTETTLPRDGDVVTVELLILNPSVAAALNGGFEVRIPDSCSYAEEPVGFQRVAGAEPSDRHHEFQHIFPNTQTEPYTIKVKVPSLISRFQVSAFFACETCVVGKKQDLWVNIR